MSGERDVQKLAQQIEDVASRVHHDGTTLEQVVADGRTTLDLYRKFRTLFTQSGLVVRKLVRGKDGSVSERDFDMATIEENGGR